MPKSKEVKQKEAIARNEKHRAKYEAWYHKEHPKATDEEVLEFVEIKIGIPQHHAKKRRVKKHKVHAE